MSARDAPLVKLSAELSPVIAVPRRQVRVVEFRQQVGCSDGRRPYSAAHDEAGTATHPAWGPPLVVATGAKQVLQGIVGAGQVRRVVAVEEALPVAARLKEEMGEGVAQE